MNVARIKNGIVVNLEVADAAWVAENEGIDEFIFIEYPEKQVVHIGFGWNEITGFEQPSTTLIDS
jgi:hypothetical protein